VTDPCNRPATGQLSRTVADNCRADGVVSADGQPGINDPSQQQQAIAGGNADLEPETADILTAGLLYEPTFAEGLALTVDYFDVKIDNSIQREGSNIILANCYASVNRSDCEKITRIPGSHFIDVIDDRTTNIGRAETNGIDAGIQYTYDVQGIGRFRHNLEGTRLLSYNEYTPTEGGGLLKHEGLGVYDLGVYPKYKGSLFTQWSLAGASAGFNVRYIHSYRECQNASGSTVNDCTIEDALDRKVKANVTADVMAGYTFASPVGKTQLSAGVNNIADQDPPKVYNGAAASSDADTYDYLGRFFYLRLSQLF